MNDAGWDRVGPQRVHLHFYSTLVYPPRRSWLRRLFGAPSLPRLTCRCGDRI